MNNLSKHNIINCIVIDSHTVWSSVITIGEVCGVFSATISGSCDISIPVREMFDCDPAVLNTN